MSFPGATKNTRDQLKEAGGTPMALAAVGDGEILQRDGYTLKGISSSWLTGSGATVRLSNGYLEVKNNDTGLWHRITITGSAGFETLGFDAGTV